MVVPFAIRLGPVAPEWLTINEHQPVRLFAYPGLAQGDPLALLALHVSAPTFAGHQRFFI
ncbi:hypothetical protein [Paracoccus alkanivorans]|uniref:hypothetical protein n=1 Tax=Paracoccus alkanivorans TaxID=2116655 RepID=UPI00140C3F41|nr:hypothetical protein [Paracoccus alkanivorans]